MILGITQIAVIGGESDDGQLQLRIKFFSWSTSGNGGEKRGVLGEHCATQLQGSYWIGQVEHNIRFNIS